MQTHNEVLNNLELRRVLLQPRMATARIRSNAFELTLSAFRGLIVRLKGRNTPFQWSFENVMISRGKCIKTFFPPPFEPAFDPGQRLDL